MGRMPYAHTAARPNIWQTLLPVLLLAAVLILPMICLGVGYAAFRSSDTILPGVTVGSAALGGLSRQEAAQRIDAFWNGEHRLTVSDGKRTWSATPIEMGLWVDPQATVDRAYQVGRGPDGFSELATLFTQGSISLAPSVVYSSTVSRDRLERLAPEVNQPAQNASLRLENGRWVGVPAVNGSVIDIDQTLRRVSELPETVMTSGYFPLFTQPVTPHVPDPAPLLQQLDSALSRPLNLRAYDPITDQTIEWQVPRETFESWVTVSVDGGETDFGLDPSHLAAYLDEWKASLGPERTLESITVPPELASMWLSGQPFTVLIHHNPTVYTVQAGDTLTRVAFKVGMPYWKIELANPGVDLKDLYPGQALNIPSPNDMLPAPIVIGKRIVISITEQRMRTYENGSLRSEYVISTGIASSPTYPGIYQVRSHELDAYASVWDLHMPYFMGIYEGWPGFMNGIHGLPTLSSGVRLWGSVLGRPASYGCIILGMEESEALYNWAEDGVVVEIQP